MGTSRRAVTPRSLAVRAVDLRKIYGTATPVRAVDGVSLSIRRGEIVALVGASGSGKSTLLHMIGGLETPSSGSIAIAGSPVFPGTVANLDFVRGTLVGFVFQDFHLIATKMAIENVALPLAYRGVPRAARLLRAEAALDRVGLGHRRTHLPSQLSGGEKQRVAIARAIVTEPQVLIADEPTGNLDSTTEKAILDLLVSTARDSRTALVVATHSERVAAAADRVVPMSDGRIVVAS